MIVEEGGRDGETGETRSGIGPGPEMRGRVGMDIRTRSFMTKSAPSSRLRQGVTGLAMDDAIPGQGPWIIYTPSDFYVQQLRLPLFFLPKVGVRLMLLGAHFDADWPTTAPCHSSMWSLKATIRGLGKSFHVSTTISSHSVFLSKLHSNKVWIIKHVHSLHSCTQP